MQRRRIGLIGFGAIARAATAAVRDDPDCADIEVSAVLLRRGREPTGPLPPGCRVVHDVDDLVDLAPSGVFECASHEAVRTYAEAVLATGTDLSLISIGALTDIALLGTLKWTAAARGARLSILPGAIPGIEALSAARLAGLERVIHTVSKPPVSWRGTAAEDALDIGGMNTATVIYDGPAHNAASRFPSNANSTAAIALAGIGFERTRTVLIADPSISMNVHRLEVQGDFGNMLMEVEGRSLPGHPKTSSLAALSVARAIKIQRGAIAI